MLGALHSWRKLSVLGAAGLLVGCASPPRLPVVEDVHPQRLERQEAVVRQFNAQRDQAEYAAALDAWRQRDVADCRERLERLLSRNSGHRAAALLWAEVALAEQTPQTALPHLERVAAERPDDAEVQRALVRLDDAARQPSVALAGYEQATPPPATSAGRGLAAGPAGDVDERECTTAAGACLRRGDPAEAARLAELGVQAHPQSAALYRLLGLAHYRGGNYRAAEAALSQALSLDNSSALAYFLLGSALHRLGETEAAETHFRRARSLDPRF